MCMVHSSFFCLARVFQDVPLWLRCVCCILLSSVAIAQADVSLFIMADDLETRHGCMLRQPPYNAQTSWYQMKNALAARRPPIKVSTQVMRSWWDTYRGEAGESSQSSSSMTAIQLQYQYGEMLKESPWNSFSSAYVLHKALAGRQPAIKVSYQAVRTWWGEYRLAIDSAVLTVQQLEDQYGDSIRHLAAEYPTSYKLTKALLTQTPPLCIDSIEVPKRK